MTEKDFSEALKEAYRRAGTQQRLADEIGLSQSTIAGYFSGRYSVGNMTVSTLVKIFPAMTVDFFGESTGDCSSDLMRKQLLAIFDSLPPEEKMRCLAMVIANFPDKIKEETKR